MEMKRVLELEGRDAKNLIAYRDNSAPKTFHRKAPPACTGPLSSQQQPSMMMMPPPPLPLQSQSQPHHKRMQPPSVIVDTTTTTMTTTTSQQLHHHHLPTAAGSSSSSSSSGPVPRVRSASTGRDKRSELHARYWALLFGNLQRAISEIYATVECYENLSSCQETILVLENYIRDFRALADWFQVSWDYESRPQQQRHDTPLAWDVRKSNPTSPRLRARSLSNASPTPIVVLPHGSGRSSPCPVSSYSGKNSPCPTIEECDQLQRHSANITANDHNDVPECDALHSSNGAITPSATTTTATTAATLDGCALAATDFLAGGDGNGLMGGLESVAAAVAVVETAHQYCQTDLEDENLTLIQWRQKYEPDKYPPLLFDGAPVEVFGTVDDGIVSQEECIVTPAESFPAVDIPEMLLVCQPQPSPIEPSPTAANATINQLNAMESQFLRAEIKTKAARPSDIVPLKHVQARVDTHLKKTGAAPATAVVPKYSSVLNRNNATAAGAVGAAAASTSIRARQPPNGLNSSSSISARTPLSSTRHVTVSGACSAKAGASSTSSLLLHRKSDLPAKPATARLCLAAKPPVSAQTTLKTTPASAPATQQTQQKMSQQSVVNQPAKRFASRSKTMIELPNNKSRSSVNSVINANQRLRRISREDIASSSSTLKASNEMIGSRSSLVGGSRTHLQRIDNGGGGKSRAGVAATVVATPVTATAAAAAVVPGDEGWLMVKAKRRSSLHWANRFNQPTGYASLPSLALQASGNGAGAAGEPDAKFAKKENNGNGNNNNGRKQVKSVATSATAATGAKLKGSSAGVTVTPNSNVSGGNNRKVKVQQNALVKDAVVPAKCNAAASLGKPPTATKTIVAKASMISNEQRQKSDLTGLKLATLRREYMRTANRNKALANPAAKPPTSEEPDTNNVYDDNTQHSPISAGRAGLTPPSRRDLSVSSSCDESEYRDADIESDEDQRKLLEEQESLERQIRELQNTEIDVDTETDETDCETIHEDAATAGPNGVVDYLTSASVNGTSVGELDADAPRFVSDASAVAYAADGSISLETRYQLLLSDMSVGERTETLATLRAFVARHPGRAQELHQKLSSPSRRRSLHETLKLYQAKHARAQAKRDALNREKAHKIQVLLARVEDVKAAKQQLIEEKRLRMEERLQRAAENRTQYLRDKIRKAHDEEEKMKEIAFIKNLEAQNKRLDFMESWREQEGRLLDLEQERQKRVEEKAAKEAAVEKRRLELELERQRRLEKMNETRREREQRIGEMQERREKMRQQVARDKAREREERLQALQAQQQHSTEELQRKINLKQQESARRHEENIEHIRQRALELSAPSSRTVDENGNGGDDDDDDDADGTNGNRGGAGDNNDLSSLVSDMSREYTTKSNKKRLKKIVQKVQQKSAEYMADMDTLPGYMRNSSEVPKLLGQIRKGGGPLGLERPLNQLMRLIDKSQVNDYQCFWLLDGLGVLANVVQTALQPDTEVTRRAQVIAVQLYRKLCLQCAQLARHAVLANSFGVLCDTLLRSLQTPDEAANGQPVELSTELMIACIAPFPHVKKLHAKVVERLPLVISYVVATGLVDTMSRRLLKIRESVENHGSVVLSLLATIGLLTKFGDLCPKGAADQTKFLAVVRSTELLGTISLLHSTVIPLGESIPPRTVSLAASVFRLLLTIANLDIAVFQDVLSDEALAFQLLDVATVLLTYCGPKAADNSESSAVIVDLIATLGFYCSNNARNQNRLTSEQSATIIKAFAKLPKDFELIVYPTLITVITDNAAAEQVVARDFDLTILDEYRKSKLAQKQKVVSVLHAGGGGAPAKKS